MGAATLPQLAGETLFLTDGGLETTLVFLEGVDLPAFAAFPLLDTDEGRALLSAYYRPYLELARRHGTGFVLGTPTWRANGDWGPDLGYDAGGLASLNRRATEWVADLAEQWPDVDTVLEGIVGPRGDGYVVGDLMTPDQAATYHAPQVRAFAEAGAALTTVLTMTYADEAVGFVLAAEDAGLPSVVSFTVETDGRLPSGQPLSEAVEQVDSATGGAPAYFMVNCAHPTHLAPVLEDGPWRDRVRGLRANASRMSHAELDAAEELDRGDVDELAALYAELRTALPQMCVAGGCCGTDHEHVAAVAAALLDTDSSR